MSNLGIIRKVAADCKLPVKVCRGIVDLFWEEVIADLEGKDGRARIAGFGTFHRRLRSSRVSRPPGATGKEVFSPAHYTVTFKPERHAKPAAVKRKKA